MTLNPAYGGAGGGGGGGGGSPALEHGQVRLTKSGSDVLLSRYNGSSLFIDGTVETVPTAGVTLAADGLTIDTDHFIYAFMVGATMTLEASTTGHATDSTTGVEIKSGNSTRTLVGMARPVTGPVWVDSEIQRFVISWFNRRTIVSRVITDDSVIPTTTSTVVPEIELSTDYRVEFLSWDDEMPNIVVAGIMWNDTSDKWYRGLASLDALPVAGTSHENALINNATIIASVGSPTSLTEGYHYATLLVAVQGGTASYTFISTIVTIRG